MEIKMTTQYEIGDKFYSIEEMYKYPPCKKCNGTGELELVIGGTVTCNECNGRKTNEEIVILYYKPTEILEVDTISVEINEQSETAIFYFGKDKEGILHHQGFLEDECFPTIEKAKNECDIRGERVNGE